MSKDQEQGNTKPSLVKDYGNVDTNEFVAKILFREAPEKRIESLGLKQRDGGLVFKDNQSEDKDFRGGQDLINENQKLVKSRLDLHKNFGNQPITGEFGKNVAAGLDKSAKNLTGLMSQIDNGEKVSYQKLLDGFSDTTKQYQQLHQALKTEPGQSKNAEPASLAEKIRQQFAPPDLNIRPMNVNPVDMILDKSTMPKAPRESQLANKDGEVPLKDYLKLNPDFASGLLKSNDRALQAKVFDLQEIPKNEKVISGANKSKQYDLVYQDAEGKTQRFSAGAKLIKAKDKLLTATDSVLKKFGDRSSQDDKNQPAINEAKKSANALLEMTEKVKRNEPVHYQKLLDGFANTTKQYKQLDNILSTDRQAVGKDGERPQVLPKIDSKTPNSERWVAPIILNEFSPPTQKESIKPAYPPTQTQDIQPAYPPTQKQDITPMSPPPYIPDAPKATHIKSNNTESVSSKAAPPIPKNVKGFGKTGLLTQAEAKAGTKQKGSKSPAKNYAIETTFLSAMSKNSSDINKARTALARNNAKTKPGDGPNTPSPTPKSKATNKELGRGI
jgi:hypothetical protein